jgi:hypothetical protein
MRGRRGRLGRRGRYLTDIVTLGIRILQNKVEGGGRELGHWLVEQWRPDQGW